MSDNTINIIVIGKDDGATETLRQVGDAYEDIGKKSDQGAKRTDSASQVMIGALRKIGEVGVEGLAAAGQAVVGFVGDAIKQAGDFEAGLKKFSSVAGDSLAEAGYSMDDVRDKALDLGATTAFSAKQAEDAMIELAKGGVPVADVMGKATDATLDLAAAGELELAESASIVAKQLGVWSSEGVNATDVSNLLAQAANASTVNVDELALGLAQAGGVAKVTGVSFKDTVQTMALLSPGFASAADAGTSYKTFLSRLIPTTADAAGAMKDLGLSTGEGNSAFFDAQGNFVGMRKAAELLHNSTKDLSEAERQLAFNTIFGADAIRAAAMIAEKGATGFDAVGVAMNGAGTAAEQAAKRNEGFNFALESMGGSIETVGIMAGSLLLPVLTDLINTAIIPGINAIGEFVAGAGSAGSTFETIAGVVSGAAMPALVGLTAATVVYAATTLPTMIAGVTAATTALGAKAMAMMASLGPYALVAVAVGGVVAAWSDLNNKVDEGVQSVVNSLPGWAEATAALDSYSNATGQAQLALAPYANTISALRTQIEGEVEALGRRQLMGTLSEAQFAAETEKINQHRAALEQATAGYNNQEAAILANVAAGMTGTVALQELTGGELQVAQQTALTAEELEKLQKQMQKTFEDGRNAVEAYVNTEIEFMATLQQARADGFSADEVKAAQHYAQQQAAQKAHLGQMLTDYTLTQVQMGNISNEKAAQVVAAIEKEFGTQQDLSARTFLAMTADIDNYARSSGGSIDALSGQLGTQADQAVETKQRMEELSKEYTAKFLNDFDQGKITANQLRDSLLAIPSKVFSEVTISTTKYERTQKVDDDGHGGMGGRARGGPVQAGNPVWVGERGMEVFVPNVGGRIIPNDQLTDHGAAPAAGGSAAPVNNYYVTYHRGAQDERSVADDLRSLQLLNG